MATVRERLEKEKLSVRVLGPDVCRIFHLEDYLLAMEQKKSSPGTPVLTHLYDLGIPFDRVEKDADRWRTAHELAARYNRPLWLMEMSNVFSSTEPASIDEAIIWAQKIHWALVAGDCAVVCYWQLFFDKKNEALIYCAKSQNEKYEITPKFYTSMNYYKFVRPGMERCTATSSEKDVLVSAFRTGRDATGERVIVIVNAEINPRSVSYDAGDTEWSRYLTDKTSKCVKVDVSKGIQKLDLPARSVTTLVKTVAP
jgi:O-glycosyl hydrolase